MYPPRVLLCCDVPMSFYSKLLLHMQVLHLVPEAEPRGPAEETNLAFFYPQSPLLSESLELTIGEPWINSEINGEPCLQAQLPLHHDSQLQHLHHCRLCIDTPVTLRLSLTVTCKWDHKIFKFLNFRWDWIVYDSLITVTIRYWHCY